MNKSMLVGAVLGAVGVTAGGAVATYSLVNKGPEYAQVTDVQPIKQQVKTPREVCKDVAVTRQAPVKDQHQIAGTVVGALAGGLLGNQIGGGTGKKIATVAGAVGGGYAGFYTAWKLEKLLRAGEAEVTIVDPVPYMAYLPFLPEVSSGAIEPRHAVVARRPWRRHDGDGGAPGFRCR